MQEKKVIGIFLSSSKNKDTSSQVIKNKKFTFLETKQKNGATEPQGKVFLTLTYSSTYFSFLDDWESRAYISEITGEYF